MDHAIDPPMPAPAYDSPPLPPPAVRLDVPRTIEPIEHALIEPDPNNPRREEESEVFDVSDILPSVRAYGILHAIWVRSRPLGRFQIILGERRWFAAGLAGHRTVPCEVHDELTDEQVLEVQLVENATRTDIHPLREARAFARLRDERGLNDEQIADRTGKEVRLVRQRLALLTLVPEAQLLFSRGKLTNSGALELATLSDPKAQRHATYNLAARADAAPEALPLRDVRGVVRRYHLTLADAGFDLTDATLVAAAGACTECPKRTGVQRTLWADLDDGQDRCTDPKCFEGKQAAHWKRIKVQAQANGISTLEGREAERVVEHGRVGASSGYVDLGAPCDALAPSLAGAPVTTTPTVECTWKELLGEHARPSLYVRDRSGVVHAVMAKPEALAALEAAGHEVDRRVIAPERLEASSVEAAKVNPGVPVEASPSGGARSALAPDEVDVLPAKAVAAIVRAASKQKQVLRLLIVLICCAVARAALVQVAQRRGLLAATRDPAGDVIEVLCHHAATLELREVRALVVELLVVAGGREGLHLARRSYELADEVMNGGAARGRARRRRGTTSTAARRHAAKRRSRGGASGRSGAGT